MPFVFVLLAFILTTSLEAKIRLLTFHYNLPELIEVQHKTLKKYIQNDYELIVFNDAKDAQTENEIQAMCKKYGITCVRFPQELHSASPLNDQILEWANNPEISSVITGLFYGENTAKTCATQGSIRHCHVIQYALDNFGYNHNDIVALIDGDCFPIRPVNLRKLLGKNDIAGIKKTEGGVEYLWVVFTLFNPKKVPYKEDLHFNVDVVDNVMHDTGSHTFHYLNNHSDVVCQKFQGESSSSFSHWNDQELTAYGFTPNEISFLRDLDSLKGFPWPITVEFHVNNSFIHLGNSSFGLPGNVEKRACVRRFLQSNGVKVK